MSLCAFRKGHRVRVGAGEFLILQRLPDRAWQLQNTATGELCSSTDHDLLDRFANNELSFIPAINAGAAADRLAYKLKRDLAAYPAELVNLAKTRIEYLKEIARKELYLMPPSEVYIKIVPNPMKSQENDSRK